MAEDIVTRLAQEIDSLKADPQVLRDAIVEIERLRVENAEQEQGWRAERALADQLADALGDCWDTEREAAEEMTRLRAALALAIGELSTYGPMRYTSPDQLMEHFMQEARRG